MAAGAEKIRLKNGDTLHLPKIRRKTSRKQVTRDYLTEKKCAAIGCTKIVRMIAVLIDGKQRMKQCVDYCFGVLILEDIRKMEKIVTRTPSGTGSC